MSKLLLFLAVYAVLNVIGLSLLKMGLRESTFMPHFSLSMKLVVGFLFYILGFAMWLYILNSRELIVAFPLAVGSLIIATTLSGIVIFHEQLSWSRIAGITFILIGIILLKE